MHTRSFHAWKVVVVFIVSSFLGGCTGFLRMPDTLDVVAHNTSAMTNDMRYIAGATGVTNAQTREMVGLLKQMREELKGIKDKL